MGKQYTPWGPPAAELHQPRQDQELAIEGVLDRSVIASPTVPGPHRTIERELF
jgi:hypothetical protein